MKDFFFRFPYKYHYSRFALEMMVVREKEIGEHMATEEDKSIDDEYTPGIFKVIADVLQLYGHKLILTSP